jgi:hypothetical protein
MARIHGLLLAAGIILVGCGGAGGGTSSSSSGGGRTCGPNYLTPNYVLDNDPNNGQLNRLLFWERFPLRVAFRNDKTYPDGSGGMISVALLAEEAFGRWQTASSGGVQISRVGSTSEAEVSVTFSTLPSRPGAGGTLGTTSLSFIESSGRIVSASIEIATWPGMTVAELFLGLKATAAHEFGHALFLLGHSENAGDLMFPSVNLERDKMISTQDINSLFTSYCGSFGRSPVDRSRKPEGPIKTITIACKASAKGKPEASHKHSEHCDH